MTRTGASEVIAAAVGQAAESLGRDRADPEQLGLLPPTRFEGAAAADIRAKLEQAHSGRGGGRPKGAENRLTAQFRKYLLAHGADPLLQLVRWGSHTPSTLALELGCTTAEAFDRLERVWSATAAYLHPRLAPVNDDGQAVPLFNMTIMANAAAGIVASDREPWMGDPEVRKALEMVAAQGEQNQGLSDDASVRPADHGSHVGGEDAENNDELPL